MITKQELIKLLETAEYWEEDFILKYDTQSNWALLRSSLPKKLFKRIEALLRENLKDTARHKKIVSDLINDVKSGQHGL